MQKTPRSKTFFSIAASVAEGAVVNPTGTKTFLANSLSTFPIKCKPVFVDVQDICHKNCPITLDNWVL